MFYSIWLLAAALAGWAAGEIAGDDGFGTGADILLGLRWAMKPGVIDALAPRASSGTGSPGRLVAHTLAVAANTDCHSRYSTRTVPSAIPAKFSVSFLMSLRATFGGSGGKVLA
jgi:hypothetical protein